MGRGRGRLGELMTGLGVCVERAPVRQRVRVAVRSVAPQLSWWRELLLVGITYAVYEFSRGIGAHGLGTALRNGRDVLHLEQMWHLDPEATLNHGLAHVVPLAVAASYFYSTAHYIVTPSVLIWMYRRQKAHYRLVRTALAFSTVLGLVGFYLLPTAPPRLLAGSGIRDTLEDVSDWGWWSSHGSVPRGLGQLSNQFAAMPSLHVGWALWCGVLIATFARRTWVRVLGALYPVTTTLVVLATGNHYLLDAFAGVACMALGTSLALIVQRFRRPQVPPGMSEAQQVLELAG
jgi:hypothetical protein